MNHSVRYHSYVTLHAMKGKEGGRKEGTEEVGKEKKQNKQRNRERQVTNFYALFLLHLKRAMSGVRKLAPPVVVMGKSTSRAGLRNHPFK